MPGDSLIQQIFWLLSSTALTISESCVLSGCRPLTPEQRQRPLQEIESSALLKRSLEIRNGAPQWPQVGWTFTNNHDFDVKFEKFSARLFRRGNYSSLALRLNGAGQVKRAFITSRRQPNPQMPHPQSRRVLEWPCIGTCPTFPTKRLSAVNELMQSHFRSVYLQNYFIRQKYNKHEWILIISLLCWQFQHCCHSSCLGLHH